MTARAAEQVVEQVVELLQSWVFVMMLQPLYTKYKVLEP
jgi:hypothetical protein